MTLHATDVQTKREHIKHACIVLVKSVLCTKPDVEHRRKKVREGDDPIDRQFSQPES